MKIQPTYGISSQIEINLDAQSSIDPLKLITDASNVGLYIRLFGRDGQLWVQIAGSLDAVVDFQSSL